MGVSIDVDDEIDINRRTLSYANVGHSRHQGLELEARVRTARVEPSDGYAYHVTRSASGLDRGETYWMVNGRRTDPMRTYERNSFVFSPDGVHYAHTRRPGAPVRRALEQFVVTDIGHLEQVLLERPPVSAGHHGESGGAPPPSTGTG